MKFAAVLTLLPFALPALANAGGDALPLVPQNSVWRYLDDGSDQGTAWREPGFDDSGWGQGAGSLGFGDPQATTLNPGAITYYFRHRFQVSEGEIDSVRGRDGFYRLVFDLLRDDGAVIYLNGIELVRSNMEPGVAIDHLTLASASVSNTDETTYMPQTADSGTALRTGENVLAVEVHQATADSSDISFDLALSASPRGAFWNPGPDMVGARRAHTAVRLLDGRVLVAGGRVETHVATAEIFDPLTDTWTATGSMNVARSDHQSILLADGKVLVFSGRVGGIDITSAEVYDPETGIWTMVDSLTSGRFAPLVVRLEDGKVLVAGGFNQGGTDDFLRTAELFDPATGLWTNTGSYITGANKQIGFLLGDGKVLSAGGYDGGASRHRNAELYDPATGRWSNTGFMFEKRYRFAGALLDDGRVLAIAGGNDGTSNNRSSEIYNPATGTWTASGSLAFRRRDHLSATLPGGQVIIAGGGIGASEVFDPATGSWALGGEMTMVRGGFTMTSLLDGRVLVAGGRAGDVTQSSTEFYGQRLNPTFEQAMASYPELSPEERLRFANPDGDDLINLLEHGFGLDPTDAGDPGRGRLPGPVISAGRVALQFTIPNPPPPDVIYRVFASDNLTAGERDVIATRAPDGTWSGAAEITADLSKPGERAITVSDLAPIAGGDTRFLWLELSISAP